MKRVRTTALTALGFLGGSAWADEPIWKAPSLTPAPAPHTDVIVVVPRTGGATMPIPTPPAAAQPEVLQWGQSQTPKKVEPEVPVAKPVPAAPAPVPPPAAPPAPPAFPIIISDFTQPAVPVPMPMAKPAEHPPEFRAVAPAPNLAEADVPPARKIPPVEVAPIPKPVPESKPLPKPNEVPPAPLPPTVAAAPKGDCELEPVPGMFTSPYPNASRHGVYGSPGVQLSRDYAFRDGIGLDMEKPARDAALVQDRYFVQTEYLMWWMNPQRIPTLATTNTIGNTGLPNNPGILGNPGTQNLIGPGTIGPTFFNGFRVRAGAWLESDCDPIHGIDASYFFLGQRSTTQTISGLPVISRPFTQAGNGQQAVEVVAQPGISVGRFVVSADSSLWGADVNYKQVICRECDRSSAWFAGYRTLTLQESLIMEEFITSTGASPPLPNPPGTQIYVQDSFVTQNTFHGGQLGYMTNRRLGRWDVDLRASAAIGFTKETVTINGFQLVTRPGQATQSFQGGLLAIGTNIGTHTQNRFAVVPEATVNVGYSLLPNLRAYVGYNFLYWSNVVRPGDQIDPVLDVASVPNLNPNAVPSGQARPAPTFTQAGLFVQGVQLGLDWRW